MKKKTQTHGVGVGIEQINSRRWTILARALKLLVKEAGVDADFEISENKDDLQIKMKC